MLTSSRRIDKCTTSGQRFSDKFPTVGTGKMKKALQMPGGISMLVTDWAIMRLQYIFDITKSQVIGKISSL